MKEGWEVKKMIELGITQTGTTPKTSEKENYSSFIPFIKPADIDFTKAGDLRYDNEGLSEIGLKKGRRVENGSIFMVYIGATIGNVGFSEQGVSCNQQINTLTLKKGYETKFFYYAMTSKDFQDKVILEGKGAQATLPIINKTKWENLTVTFSKSLPEQKRIVAILDEAFSGIARAKEIAEKNLANAREVFEGYLDSVFANPGKDWKEKRLDGVCEISSRLIDPKEKNHLDLYHVGGANIVSKSEVLIDLKTAQEENLISGKFAFDQSMVLYSKIRPYLIKVARPDFSGICSADIYPLKPNALTLNKDFLYYLLLSNSFTDYAIKGSARAGMPKVNREHLFAFSTFFPSIQEQKKIIAKLDALSLETQKVQSIYQQKLSSLAELKKPLLHQAFTGELS